MALVVAVTKVVTPHLQPFSFGSVKAVLVEVDVTSYLSPTTLVPDTVGLSRIDAILPIGISDQAKIMKSVVGQAPNVFKLFAQADGTTEVANDADAGMTTCLILGA